MEFKVSIFNSSSSLSLQLAEVVTAADSSLETATQTGTTTAHGQFFTPLRTDALVDPRLRPRT